MAWYYVHCIVKKPNHDDPYTRIHEYGVSTNVIGGEGRERWSEEKMIDVLEQKEHVVKAYGKKPGSTEKEYVELEVVAAQRQEVRQDEERRRQAGQSPGAARV